MVHACDTRALVKLPLGGTVAHPEQCAVVRRCRVSSQTLMDKAGPQCSEVLEVHKEVDLLHMHIKPILGYEQPQAVELHNLRGKGVILHDTSCDYIASTLSSTDPCGKLYIYSFFIFICSLFILLFYISLVNFHYTLLIVISFPYILLF